MVGWVAIVQVGFVDWGLGIDCGLAIQRLADYSGIDD
jgi:hypothetical protein